VLLLPEITLIAFLSIHEKEVVMAWHSFVIKNCVTFAATTKIDYRV
jgi:hypothetical protein